MQSNKPVIYGAKKQYSTVASLLLSFVEKVLIVSFCSWLLLVIWFVIRDIIYDGNSVIQQTNLIIKTDIDYIPGKLLTLLEHYSYWLDQCTHKISIFILIDSQNKIDLMLVVLCETLKIVLFRLIAFLMNLPLFACLIFVFIVDGLGQRDIRKFQCARESSFLFRRFKPMIGKLFVLLFLVYMSMPFAIQPQIILLPMALILGLLLMILIKNYKKYL